MRPLVSLLVALSIGAISPAFATDPENQSATTPSTQAKAEAPPVAKTEAPSGDSQNQPDKTLLKQIKAMGWKPEKNSNGLTVYCRSEASLGTRFATKRCSSAEEIERLARDSRESLTHAQRQGTARNPGQ
jgi:hypothetical protein